MIHVNRLMASFSLNSLRQASVKAFMFRVPSVSMPIFASGMYFLMIRAVRMLLSTTISGVFASMLFGSFQQAQFLTCG